MTHNINQIVTEARRNADHHHGEETHHEVCDFLMGTWVDGSWIPK